MVAVWDFGVAAVGVETEISAIFDKCSMRQGQVPGVGHWHWHWQTVHLEIAHILQTGPR